MWQVILLIVIATSSAWSSNQPDLENVTLSCIDDSYGSYDPYGSYDSLDPFGLTSGPIGWEYVSGVRCFTSTIQIDSPGQLIIPSDDITPGSYDLLEFQDQVIQYIPKGIVQIFPELIGLRIYNSGLKDISQDDLKPLTKLIYLNLEYNKLVILENDLFEFNTQLKYVSFDYNKLKIIGEKLLAPLETSEFAGFNNAGCLTISFGTNYNYGISSFESSVQENCLQPEAVAQKLHSKELKKLKHKYENLKLDVSSCDKSYESCDGNLNTATRILHNVVKGVETYKSSIVSRYNGFISSTGDIKLINMTCYQSFDNICEVKDLKVDSDYAEIDKIYDIFDKELSSFERSQIVELIVNKQEVFFLPINLGKTLPQLQKLSVTFSGLYELNLVNLESLGQLQTLNISSNKIREIPANAFEASESLTDLDLSSNFIAKLEPEVFKNLKNLEELRINNNLLAEISSGVFESLKKLKILYLQNNKLQFISANLLTPLQKLQVIDLGSNACMNMKFPAQSLKEIEAEIIDNCIAPIDLTCNNETFGVCKAENLTTIYQKTRISKIIIESKSDETSADITELIIINQSIKFLPFDLAVTFPKLEKIVIENSKLTSLLKEDFKGLTALKTFKVNRNNLSSIEEGALDYIGHLEVLDLSENHIQSLPPKIFAHLLKLQSLILSHNQIKHFSADLLPRRNSIKEFRIDNNELEIIKMGTLRYLRKADIVDFTENTCIDMKFEKGVIGSRTLIELSGEVDFNCSADD